MEDRVQGIEQMLQQAVQQLAAMQVQQAQTEQQLHEAREAAATRRRRPRQRQGKESEQAEVVSQGAPAAAVVPTGSESIRACLVDLTPSTDLSPNGVIGAR